MSTVIKKGLGARILAKARAEEVIEIEGERVLVRQMNGELLISTQLDMKELIENQPEAEEGEEEGEATIDMAKLNPELLSRVAFECTFDPETERPCFSSAQSKALPFGLLVEIFAHVSRLTQGEADDDPNSEGDTDTKDGSTAPATS